MKTFIKVIIIPIYIVGLLISMSTLASSGDTLRLQISYDDESKTLRFSGKVSETPHEFLIIRIIPYTENQDLSTDAMISSDFVLTKTIISDSNGEVDASIILPDNYLGKRFSYIFSSSTEKQSGMFVAVNTDLLRQLVKDASVADQQTMILLLREQMPQTGLDNTSQNKDYDFMAQILVNERPDTGYTTDAFIKAYMIAEGMVYVKQRNIEPATFFKDYAPYFEKDYLKVYDGFSSEGKKFIDTEMKMMAPSESFDVWFQKVLFTANVRTAQSYTMLQNLVLDYCSQKDERIVSYIKLDNSYYQENVFRDLYVIKSEFTNEADIFAKINQLSEYYLDVMTKEANRSSNNGGGSGSGKSWGSVSIPKNIVSSPESSDMGQPLEKNKDEKSSFYDISKHWAKQYIEKIKDMGVISGYTDGSFRPDVGVTRAEFIKMLISVLEVEKSEKSFFSDVPEDAWYFSYISTAAQLNIITGYDGLFHPEGMVTRQDACLMIYRAFRECLPESERVYTGYEDESEISDYAKGAVQALTTRNIVNGFDSKFYPLLILTRAEATTILAKIVDGVN